MKIEYFLFKPEQKVPYFFKALISYKKEYSFSVPSPSVHGIFIVPRVKWGAYLFTSRRQGWYGFIAKTKLQLLYVLDGISQHFLSKYRLWYNFYGIGSKISVIKMFWCKGVDEMIERLHQSMSLFNRAFLIAIEKFKDGELK